MWATENMGEEIRYARVILINGVRNIKQGSSFYTEEINISEKS
jgi:hypothetical protein